MRQTKSLTLTLGVCLAAFSVGKVSITSASYSPDGTRIVIGDSAGAVKVLDAITYEILLKIQGNVSQFQYVKALFSPDGGHIVISSANGLSLLNSKTGQKIAQLSKPPSGSFALNYSLDGTRFQVANNSQSLVFDMVSLRQIQRFGTESTSFDTAELSPSGSLIAISTYNEVEIRDTLSGANVVTFPIPGGAQSLCFSKDGTRILAGMRDHTARIWNTKTGKQLTVFRGHREWVRSAEFSTDQTKIVTASGVPTKCFGAYSGPADYTVRVWDAKSGRELRKFECHSGMVNGASFSPDGTRIISVSVDGTSKVLEVKSGKVLHTLN